ncbi:MAG: cyclic lactone autoinducer peptide [Bacilli bacterium]|nr:cyclic lactone autoinducer peptide [Bacilli bacterium]
MEFLANLLSGVAATASETPHTPWVIADEPECPEELI